MPRVYSQKRSEQSLGEELRERRILLEISIDEVSQKSGIPTKYIRRLERGDWENLPGEIYTKGMLRRYARAVGGNPEKVIAQYETEHEKNLEKKPTNPEGERRGLYFSPRTVRFTIFGIVLVVILGYIIWQLSPILAEPDLVVTEPVEEETLTFKDNTILAGKTEPGVSLYLNDQPVSLTADGEFSQTIELLPGLNILEIRAVSRFGKESVVERKVIFQE